MDRRPRALSRRALSVLAALAVAVPLAGVSSCEKDDGRVILSLTGYFDDLAQERFEAACRDLTPLARHELSVEFAEPCAHALAQARQDRKRLPLAKINGVRIAATSATVRVIPYRSNPDAPVIATLRRVGDRWLVADPYVPMSDAAVRAKRGSSPRAARRRGR